MSRLSAPAKAATTKAAMSLHGDEEDRGFTHVRTSVAKTGFTKPAGAVRSVFDQVPPAKPKPRAARQLEPLPSFEDITIEDGVPLAPAKQGSASALAAKQLLQNIKPGQSVLLSRQQARYLKARAKALNVAVAVRTLTQDTARVWRLQDGGEA